LGSWAGTRLFRSSSTERFYRLLQLVLLAAAAALFVRGLVFLAA